jgi:hypothetical protein
MNDERVEAAAKAAYESYWASRGVENTSKAWGEHLSVGGAETRRWMDIARSALSAADAVSGERVDKENWTASFLDSINTHLRECGVFHGHDQVKNAADGLSVLRSIFGHANSDRSELSTAHKSLAVLREVCNAREQHYFEPTVGTLHRLNLAEAVMDSSQALTIPKAIGSATGAKVEQVTHATLDAKSLYEISVCANALDGLTRLSGPDANTRTTETAAYWSKKLRALVDNHMRRGAEVAAELYIPAKNSSCGK